MNAPKRKLLSVAIAIALSAGTAKAELARMGPISNDPTIGGVPTWFQDRTGLTIDFCSLLNQSELDGGWCVLIPPGLSFPEHFPDKYFDEHFYYAADNGLKDANTGTRARLVIALEAAFANGAVVPGDQMVFGRHRVFITNLPFDGDYRVITPYKDTLYTGMKAGDRIFETEDIGTACIGTFECALGATIGPWLLPSPVAGGPELPPIPDLQAGSDPFYDALVATGAPTPYPGTGRKYLADPARIGPITGSPMPPFFPFNDAAQPAKNPNTFRVEGPNGWSLDGENNFTISGRVMTGAIPGQLSVDRASYTMDATGALQHVDVFAKAAETQPARLPATAVPPKTIPILSFFDVPCAGAIGVDPVTLLPIINPPPYLPPAVPEIPMVGNGSDYWAQSQTTVLPSHVCVKDATARNALGQIAPAYFLKAVRDDVTVTAANFAIDGTLSLNAVSSDQTAKLTATAIGPNGVGLPLDAAGNASVLNLLAPPSKVQVVSTGGGSAIVPVLTSTTAGGVSHPGPVAVADSVTILEDSGATTLDPLANDSNAAGGTITITQAPALGTASISAGKIIYTPKLNANGVDAIGYTVTVGTVVSNQAAITINITPVNDAPVAVNDSIDAVAARQVSFSLIAKATDPDGNADVKNALIVPASWPASLGPLPIPLNGVISFTPLANNAAFSTTFSYQVVDAGGLSSANTATGTVNVKPSEAISFSKAIFVGAGKVGGAASTRWTVTGADTVKAGQTLTVAYNSGITNTGINCAPPNPTVASCIIGTAVVDSAGNYSLDKVGTPGGLLDPNDKVTWPTKPGTVRVFSSSPVLGGSNSTGISFK